MTMLDPVTGWFEIVEVPSYIIEEIVDKKLIKESIIDKSSARISRLFEQTWLSRYPRPKQLFLIMDQNSRKTLYPY